MRLRFAGRLALLSMVALVLPSCGRPETPAKKTVEAPRDEVPAAELSSVMTAHYRGLGAMERYDYAEAAAAFREVHARAPGWSPGSINLAIALLNQGGEAADKAKGSGQDDLAGAPKLNIDEANQLLDDVLVRQPSNPWALFSRGIILQFKGRLEEAHRDFKKVTEIDPTDANAWLELGGTLTDPDRPGMKAGKAQAGELVRLYSKAVECNPYLTTAMYKLAFAYQASGDPKAQVKLLQLFSTLNPDRNAAGSGEVAKLVYGEMGRYARVIDPFDRPREPEKVAPSPRFDPPLEIRVTLPDGHRWAKSTDFTGPLAIVERVRARFGQAVATFDADLDGKPDLYLTAAVVGPKGVHDVLLLNKGDNRYEDATAAFGLPEDRAGLGVAAGDFDADRRIDLFLTGSGDSRLYRNVGKTFEDVTRLAGIDGSSAVALTARWLDLDQDGDLDLYVLNHAPIADAARVFTDPLPSTGLANAVYRNDGKPGRIAGRPEDNWTPLATATADLPATEGLSITFSTAFPGLEALQAGKGAHVAVAALDIDEDRDIDLVVAADGGPPLAILNDRAGAFHGEPLKTLESGAPISGLLATDLDKDGRTDLVALSASGRASAWRNASSRSAEGVKLALESRPIDAQRWRGAHAVDLDLDTWVDLVGLPHHRSASRGRVTRGPGWKPGRCRSPSTGRSVSRLLASPWPTS